MNSRDRLHGLILGNPQSPPVFLPLLGSVLSQLSHTTATRLFSDATGLFKALRDAQELIRADANLVLVESHVFAESLGAVVAWDNNVPAITDPPWRTEMSQPSGEFGTSAATLLDVLRRLRLAETSVGSGLILPGPIRLGQALSGSELLAPLLAGDPHAEDVLDGAGQLLTEMITASGEIEADIAVFIDDDLAHLAAADPDLARLGWGPVTNLCGFYELPVVLAVPGDDHPSIEGLETLSPWAVVTENWGPMLDSTLSSLVGIGFGAERMMVDESEQRVEDLLGGLPPDSLPSRFVSTTTPLPATTEISRLRAIRNYLDQWGS